MNHPVQRGKASGSFVIQTIGLIFISLLMAALAVDFAFYFAVENKLQTTADSASLAAVSELYRNTSVDTQTKLSSARSKALSLAQANIPGLNLDTSDVVFGFIDPNTKVYKANAFTTPSPSSNYSKTGGYNAVWVRVKKDGLTNSALPTLFANLFQVTSMKSEAQSVALMDQSISSINNGGLRPIYVCENQFNTAMSDGVPENNVVRIYGDHVEVDGVQNFSGCPAMGSGNWGYADLRDCSAGAVGSSTIRDWLQSGYPGTVNVGQCYSTSPGNFIASTTSVMDTLIQNQTIFPLPLYNSWSGNGSNTKVNISGFVGFKMTGYKANGAADSRYIEGRFYRYICKTGCSTTSGSSGTTSPGGAVVKLRLAALN